MIRINLLGKSKPKSRRSAMATTAIEFESGGSPNSSNAMAAIIVLAITVGSIWWYQTQLNNQAVEIKEAYQDEAEKKLQAFNFSLICEKLPPNAAGKKS